MSLADVTSARSSPTPACPECDTTASVTSDLHKYQVACTCLPSSAQYACADDPGPPPPAKTDTPPALPPRPPTSVLVPTNRRNNSNTGCNGQDASCRRRKYAWWCVGCGALAAALGGLLAAQHILVRAYTASPHHLETVPAAVPAAMLVLTGVCIMSLARRRNRYSYMIKVVGACCLMCALTCVLVTITTTVIHMNKLQTLKFCEYTKLTRTCTCFSVPPDSQHANEDEGVRCVFEGVSECGVVHGALYWCLRGVFALSVSAVLVCIFSCMLAYQLLRVSECGVVHGALYWCLRGVFSLSVSAVLVCIFSCMLANQLLSHERKKMYWEQLELRCRSLYRPPSGQAAPTAGRPAQNNCSCCAQCHPAQPAWDISLQHRFWAPGRIGNLYSPNPGTGRKTSAWSWFPWPRSTSQNSRCRMGGVPQSGDSAYGFCDTDGTPSQTPQAYDERAYPANFNQPQFRQGGQFVQGQGSFGAGQGNFQNQANFTSSQGNFPSQNFTPQSNFSQSQGNFAPGYQEGFAESSGSFDAQTGVWGPPPPYSPQGRGGSRHHLHHQDPATATLLHHHHIDVHRTMPHDHTQTHTCTRNSYLHNVPADRANPDLVRNQEMIRANPELARMNTEMARLNPEISRLNPEINRLNPEISRLNPEISRLNPEMSRLDPELCHMMEYPNEEEEMAEYIQDANWDHMRPMGPYTGRVQCHTRRVNVHKNCGREYNKNVAIECAHLEMASKVSDQSSESCQKQGKENLGFQNDKHSPIRSSLQDCRAANQNAESEVYFADVSSCCNVSVQADCCINPNVSALVGTIENHPESTSESDTGSFTLTRQQRPQPQVGSKRRPRQADKHKTQEKLRQNVNSSLRLTEHQIEQLNMRMNERIDPRMDRNEMRLSERINDSRDRLNERNDSRDRLNGSRNELDRVNDSRICDRMNETRLSERLSEKMNDSRFERMNESRISERLADSRCVNETRVERINDSRLSDRINETRISERMNDARINRINDSDRMNESRHSDRMNESRISDRMNESRISDRMNESRISDRMNESRISDRMNDSRISDRIERMSELNSSIRIEGSPKMRSHISPLRMPRTSPKTLSKPQSSSESKPDFFVPPPPIISPLSPNTEESLLSDDDRPQDQVYSNDPEPLKCLGPDSQYEPVNDKVEILKTNHHHCYSDTNTMDSGWQSGSEKQVTD